MTLACSDADRAAGDSPVGSASSFSRFLLIDYRAPWSRQAADDAVRDCLDEAQQRAVAADPQLRVFAIRPVNRRRERPVRPWMTGSIGVGGVINSADSATPTTLIGVCTNAKRDRCCAMRGRPVVTALHDEFGDTITEISHLGGHRFAATMLVLPFGYYYGHLDAASARRVTLAALEGLVDPLNLRGRADLSPAVQAADAYWRRELGPAPIDAVQVLAANSDGDITTVSALVDGAPDTRTVRYCPGARIDETVCGGKPIQTGQWLVR